MWNERYNRPEYVYGKEPNQFLADSFQYIKSNAKILSLCEGEGRNAVFLAEKGHHLTCVDSSSVGLKKARLLATKKNVSIQTLEKDLSAFSFQREHWDAVVSIFCHLPSVLRKKIHHNIVYSLKKDGILILESYSKEQLKYKTGGPKTIDMLIDLKTTLREFEGLEFILARELVRDVNEGEFHTGPGAVVQIIGRKL